MPSPFPGMDPYLETPALFPGLHNRLISLLSESLQAVLPPPYFAEISERVWVEVSQRFIEPDTSVLYGVRAPGAPGNGGGPATTAARSRPVVVTVPHDERREPYVEIRTVRDEGEHLVTAIELLSPSNKTPGERGRELYLRKQREVLDSTTHLVEIDLLRGGAHTTAVPLERLIAQVGSFDYHVSIHRFDRFEDYVVYPIRLAEPLPAIEIPLLPGDSDVWIDLQTLFDRAYDTGPYRRRVRYAGGLPVPPLRPDQAEWATQRLRELGITTT
ncbi:MAG: DUF4058 family protein [Isosphaeraceae bacterium]|nr:DUF4058 family protein [Isosphaeraceae bacterium]